jgi:hypothetical protein
VEGKHAHAQVGHFLMPLICHFYVFVYCAVLVDDAKGLKVHGDAALDAALHPETQTLNREGARRRGTGRGSKP